MIRRLLWLSVFIGIEAIMFGGLAAIILVTKGL